MKTIEDLKNEIRLCNLRRKEILYRQAELHAHDIEQEDLHLEDCRLILKISVLEWVLN